MLVRPAVRSRAHALLKALQSSKGTRQTIILNDINELVNENPQVSELFRKKINDFVLLSQNPDESINKRARQTLALIGYAEPPRSPGVRVLSIDGGGTRGLVSIEILRHIERKTQKRVHELFDLICGVSSGAIITMAVGSGKFTLDQCEAFYRDVSENVFKTFAFWSSTPRILFDHAYYDATPFENTLRKAFGRTTLLSLASELNRPKLTAVSVNAHTVQPYLFRSYRLDPLIGESFDGSCMAEIWQAIRASSSAPGYFKDFKYKSLFLHDGGLLVNNCTGVAHTEANLLWPNEPVQCVVSVGSGKFKQQDDLLNPQSTSLYQKAHGIVYSATDTETVHVVMKHLVKNYFRFNPQLNENVYISENRKVKLDQLKEEARNYMLNNELMLDQLAKKLTQPRQIYKRFLDYCWPSYSQ